MLDHPEGQNQTNKRSIIGNIIFLSTGSVLSQGLTSLTFLLTARHLGPDSYGYYTSSLTLATFASILFSLGLNTWGIHESSRAPNKMSQLLGSVFLIKVVLGSLWCILMIGFAPLLHLKSFPADLVRLNVLVVWFDNLFATFLTPLIASLKNQFTSLIVTLSDFSWFLATLALISTGVDQASSFIIIRLFILLISVLITGALILRWYRPQPQTQIVKVALMGSFPYAASEILNISAKRIDVLIVAVMLGGYPVGLYAPAVSVINAVLLLFDSISGVMLPVLSNLFAHDVELAWKYARRSLWLQSAAGLTLAISLSVTAKYFVTFLGDRYQGSLEPLLIMSAILFIHAFISSSANVLTSLNQQTKRTSIQAAGVFINVLLNIFIIPRFGISGAAAVYVVTEIFLAIGYSIGVLQSYYSRDLEKEETDRVKGVPTQPSDE